MITVYIVWAIEMRPSKRQTIQFWLRPQLVTQDEKYARSYGKALGATTVQEVQIPKPDGWDDARDGL